MKISDFDYDLPTELIAQKPIEPRDASRLLVVNQANGSWEHRHFRDLGDYLRPGDLLIANQSRVLPARLLGHRAETGGAAEVFLLAERPDLGPDHWEALVRPGRRLREGARIDFDTEDPAIHLHAEILQRTDAGGRIVRLFVTPQDLASHDDSLPLGNLLPEIHRDPIDGVRAIHCASEGNDPPALGNLLPEIHRDPIHGVRAIHCASEGMAREACFPVSGEETVPYPTSGSSLVRTAASARPQEGMAREASDLTVRQCIERVGRVPLPPYIHEKLEDPERYQTVYARIQGSVAAPTAGLHFTPQLLDHLQQQGIRLGFVTLHVGHDTFRPVECEDISEHKMHSEEIELDAPTAELINETRRSGGRIIAVGTTTVRVLESIAHLHNGQIKPFHGQTRLFITPGYQFQVVEGMITNFHLPRSTLLLLVSAFIGKELMMQAYQEAIHERYRFFSFGDAMLLLPLENIAL